MGRNDDFEAGSAEGTLRDLGYSDEEIHATTGSLPAQMAEEDRLRVSLRALSSAHSDQTQARAHEAAVKINPKLRDTTPEEVNSAYNEGRRDERSDRYNSEKEAKARTPRQRSGRPANPAGQALRTARMFGSLSRKASGRKR